MGLLILGVETQGFVCQFVEIVLESMFLL